jgi:DNA-binding CsgD family transcriptional regulator
VVEFDLPPGIDVPIRPDLTPAGVTERDRHLIALLADGAPEQRIAAELGLAPSSVQRETELVRAKFGARDRAHLVALAYRLGTIELPRKQP